MAASRFNVGDTVTRCESTDIRVIEQVRVIPEYLLHGGHTWVPESDLRPMPPAVCTPSGERCDWMKPVKEGSRHFCPSCGGRLAK